MYNLALYYETVEKNYEEAKKYYGLAIDKGISKAKEKLKILEKKIKEHNTAQVKETLTNLSLIKKM